MRRLRPSLAATILILSVYCPAPRAMEEPKIWRQFVAQLKSGQFSADQIQPYEGISKNMMFGFLTRMRQGSNQEGS